MQRYKLIGGPRKQRSKAKDGEARTGKYYTQRYRVDGDPKTKVVSLQTTDLGVARRVAVEFVERKISAIENEHIHKSIDEHIEDYQASLRADGNSPKTIKEAKKMLSRVTKDARLKTLNDISVDKIKVTIHEYVEEDLIGDQTEIHYRSRWRAFANWAERTKRSSINLLAGMKVGTHRDVEIQKPRRIFTPAELAKLIANARKGDTQYHLSGEQRAVLYEVATQTGFRVQELASITPSCITWGDEPRITIKCTISKRRKTDTQEIKPATAEALRELSRGLGPHQKIWAGRWWERSTAMLRLDLEGIDEVTPEGYLTFHSTRHTFVTRVVNSGAPLPLVMEICRLSDPSLLKRYYHANGQQRRGIINGL